MIFTSAVAFLKTRKSICLGCLRPLFLYSPRFHRKVCGKKPKTNWDKKREKAKHPLRRFFQQRAFLFLGKPGDRMQAGIFSFLLRWSKNEKMPQDTRIAQKARVYKKTIGRAGWLFSSKVTHSSVLYIRICCWKTHRWFKS